MKVLSKVIFPIFMIAVIILPIGYYMKAQASFSYDDADQLFLSTLNEIFEYENIEMADVSVHREPLYDIDLNPLGAVYDFEYESAQGYAILIDDGMLQVTEFVTDGSSPYHDIDESKVYPALQLYWYYADGEFFDCDTDAEISDSALEVVSENAFSGSNLLNYDSEEVQYLYRSESKYNVLISIPSYTYGLSNGCAPVAGSNLITYYDKTYTNLIPNYEPGTTFLGKYNFRGENSTTMNLSETLHTDMGTNTTGAGTTVTQFRNGLKAYVNRQGYSITYSSLMSGGQLNYDSTKTVVQSNKAIALFLAGYRSTVITIGSGFDILAYEYAYSNHAVSGFGCLEVSYTLSNNQTRFDRYIHCAMGLGLYRTGYINVNTAQIDEALVLNIS